MSNELQVFSFDPVYELICQGRGWSQQGALQMFPPIAQHATESKGIIPAIVLPITANNWAVTQLVE